MKTTYEGRYSVDTEGNVYSMKNGKEIILKQVIQRDGYSMVTIYLNKKKYNKLVHRMVAKCFLNNYSETLQVNHMDLNKQNNSIENLEMLTAKDNTSHYLRSRNIQPFNILVYKKNFSVIVKTYKEAAQVIGYKSRGKIYDLLKGDMVNKNGFKICKIYV